MNLKLDGLLIGSLAGIVGGLLVFPMGLALALGEPAHPFWITMLIAAAVAGCSHAIGRRAPRQMLARDGFLVVTAGWLAASAIAAIPYLLSGELSLVDAWFESVSGITTTGSTVLTDIESFPESLLLWRSLTQWLGGMGIILFSIAVMPLLGVGGMQLFRAEVPGPVADKISPRIAVTARRLWGIYFGLTFAEALVLWLCGMRPLEAINHSLTSLATGGFSPRADSIGAYDNTLIEMVVVFFMFVAGMNFVLHFKLVSRDWKSVARDEEWRWYVMLILGFTLLFTLALARAGAPIGDALSDALFTVVSLTTTTGYATADFEAWPLALQGVLGVLLVVGGMAGSTGGGVKTLRTLIAFRSLRMSFRKMLHPHAVNPIVYRGRVVVPDVMNAIWGFFCAYLILAVLGMIALNLSGADMVTAWTASLTAIGNVGPGLGEVGPMDSFAWVSTPSKLVLTFLMMCGRLEIYTVLILLLPAFWRR